MPVNETWKVGDYAQGYYGLVMRVVRVEGEEYLYGSIVWIPPSYEAGTKTVGDEWCMALAYSKPRKLTENYMLELRLGGGYGTR